MSYVMIIFVILLYCFLLYLLILYPNIQLDQFCSRYTLWIIQDLFCNIKAMTHIYYIILYIILFLRIINVTLEWMKACFSSFIPLTSGCVQCLVWMCGFWKHGSNNVHNHVLVYFNFSGCGVHSVHQGKEDAAGEWQDLPVREDVRG